MECRVLQSDVFQSGRSLYFIRRIAGYFEDTRNRNQT